MVVGAVCGGERGETETRQLTAQPAQHNNRQKDKFDGGEIFGQTNITDRCEIDMYLLFVL